LAARINPAAVETGYVFEYVSQADFEASEYAKATIVPPAGEEIGSGFEDVAVTQPIGGLSPSSGYLFRVVATNALGTVPGPNQFFTTLGPKGFELPDGRVFEQVTPIDKNGAAPSGAPGFVQASPDGGGIVYASGGGIPGTEGSQQYPTYLASRSSDWSTQGLLPPASAGSSAAVLGWSEDLSRIYDVQASQPGAPTSLLQHEIATQLTRSMVAEGNTERARSYNYMGASNDGSTVLFESPSALLEGASTKGLNLYVWDSGSGELSLAGVLNKGAAPSKGVFAGSNFFADPGSFPDPSDYTQAEHAISSDGSRVFFGDAATGEIYVRENPTRPQSAMAGEECTEAALACTVHISASQKTVPDPKVKRPTFLAATPGGETAFFISSGKLTNNASTGANDEGKDLYRYDLGTGKLTDLTPDEEPGDLNGAEVQGLLGISQDGSYVYFAANGVLAPGASHGNCSGPPNHSSGTCNLYLYHDGEITFIASLQSIAEGASDSFNWAASPLGESKTARVSTVSTNGQTLLFRSRSRLTAYDNNNTPELYRYSAADEELGCVSCDPSGAAPLGPPSLTSISTLTPPSTASILSRNLSADGRRVFFETPDKLVAIDTNGDGGCNALSGGAGVRSCQDVYEWEARGTGSCKSEFQNGGCLYLISSGTSPEPSYFADASANGDNAFFFTDQQLVGQDKDQITDIYDARVGGGIASQNPSPPPPACEGDEACKDAAPPAPGTESPGSASFSGPGNQKPSREHKKHRKKNRHHKRHAQRKHR
jgi:hypothetical protein